MPTKPLESIIYRELAVAESQRVIQIASPLLQEMVNFGSNALVRVATSTSAKENEDLAVLFLYRHIIEMTDGIEVLLSQSCVNPAIPLLRSSFEALISMEYIVENEDDYVDRSLAWLCIYIYDRLKMYESLDFTTERGGIFKQQLEQDSSVIDVDMLTIDPAVLKQPINNLKSLLS
jgi:hypothetical protein